MRVSELLFASCPSPALLLQRSVYYHGMQRKCKGVSDPVDIFVYLRVGANRLHLTFKEEKQYVVLVQIVKKLSVEHLFKVRDTHHHCYSPQLLG